MATRDRITLAIALVVVSVAMISSYFPLVAIPLWLSAAFYSFGAENLGAIMRSSVVCRKVGIYLKFLHNLTAFYPPSSRI